jgi:DNA-binding FrmR family transcriptional regulator
MKQDSKKQIQNRLKRIEGQIRGLQKLIEEDAYCIDVITQTSAVRSALKSVENVLLESHLSTCVVHQIQSGKQKKAVEEILKVYKLKNK